MIGMPGCGKSTIGKLLAQTIGYDFIDLDELIKTKQNSSIANIFINEGEPAFRIIESRLLKEVLERDLNIVVASGGGAPCFHNGMENINSRSTSIYLKLSLDSLKLNLATTEKSRPLLAGVEDDNLKHLLGARSEVYESAHTIIKADGLQPEAICQKIISTLDLA